MPELERNPAASGAEQAPSELAQINHPPELPPSQEIPGAQVAPSSLEQGQTQEIGTRETTSTDNALPLSEYNRAPNGDQLPSQQDYSMRLQRGIQAQISREREEESTSSESLISSSGAKDIQSAFMTGIKASLQQAEYSEQQPTEESDIQNFSSNNPVSAHSAFVTTVDTTDVIGSGEPEGSPNALTHDDTIVQKPEDDPPTENNGDNNNEPPGNIPPTDVHENPDDENGEIGGRLDKLFNNPEQLRDKTPDEVREIAQEEGWAVGTLGKGSHRGQGLVVRELDENGQLTGRMIQWHPGGGHHGSEPYWKISSGTTGTTRIGPQFGE